MDQDVYNGCLYQDYKVIDAPSWYNFFAVDITSENYRKVCKKAKVVHFCGNQKPWKKWYEQRGVRLWWKYAWKLRRRYREWIVPYTANYLAHNMMLLLKEKIPGLYNAIAVVNDRRMQLLNKTKQ